MDFIAGQTGPIIPDPDQKSTPEQLARSESAMNLFRGNAERIKHFTQRVSELGRSGQDTVITLINVDDPNGRVLADALMPGHDWQSYRDAGEIPVARGLAAKEGIPDFLEEFGYHEAARELLSTTALRVVVIDAGAAMVLDVDFSPA